MGETVRIRSRSAQTVGALMVLGAVVGLGTSFVEGWDGTMRFGAPLVLFGLLGWAAFWQPYVEVSDGGVKVANTLRTIEISWPAIETVEGRYGLRLVTAYGPVTAWAAPAPAGRERARGQQGKAADAVTQRLDELRGAGHLDDPKLERPEPKVTWHSPLLAAIAVLVVATVALPLAA